MKKNSLFLKKFIFKNKNVKIFRKIKFESIFEKFMKKNSLVFKKLKIICDFFQQNSINFKKIHF